MNRDNNLEKGISKLERVFKMGFGNNVIKSSVSVDDTIEKNNGEFTEIEISLFIMLHTDAKEAGPIELSEVMTKLFNMSQTILNKVSFDKDGNFRGADDGELKIFKSMINRVEFNRRNRGAVGIDFELIFKDPDVYYQDEDEDDDY